MLDDEDSGAPPPPDSVSLPRVVAGAKGSGKGGSSSASSSPDTLFSTATIKIVDLICEGPTGGLVGGPKGVYLNDVAVMNPDGSLNFQGITVEERFGEASQLPLTNFPDVETPRDVGIKATFNTPVVVTVTDPDIDRVRVTIEIPALLLQKSDGSTRANTLQYRIEVKYYNGPWTNPTGDLSVTGKTSSGYYRSHEVALPKNPAGQSEPWQVRLTRLSPDTQTFNNSQTQFQAYSDLFFYQLTSIIDAKFTYPYSAVIGISAQASVFGSSVPERRVLIDGRALLVPTSYDPVSRAYSGIWDGTFKLAHSDNPAWVLYNLLVNDRYGLGEFIDATQIDKWGLYQIAQYCDQAVSDGAGGHEPRFTFNGVISTQQEAYDLLQMIAQVFRGMNYWASGAVMTTQDRPGDPVILVTEGSVIDGEFNYASSGKKARHTAALVTWHDPTNLYRETIEVVESSEGIALYGYNPTQIDLLGCTSRGQAHRAGLWTLYTELYETQVITYKAGLDHAVIRPGDIVAVQDPQISNLDLSGRLMDGSTSATLTLDRNVVLRSGVGYTISVVLPSGKVDERGISGYSDSGKRGVVSLASPLSEIPDKAAVWQISGDVVPQLFKIITITEEQPHIYAVTGLQHEPSKFAAIDDGTAFTPAPVSDFPNVVLPPTNLVAKENTYFVNGVPTQSITLSWTPGQSFNFIGFMVSATQPDGSFLSLPQTPSQSIDILNTQAGDYHFYVSTIGISGVKSKAAELIFSAKGWEGADGPTITNLQVVGGGSKFTGQDCPLEWKVKWPDNAIVYPITFVVRVFEIDTNVFLSDWSAPGPTFTYLYGDNVADGGPRRRFWVQVRAVNLQGQEMAPASLVVSNPAPDKLSLDIATISESMFVSYNKPVDPDFVAVLVWAKKVSGYNPETVPPDVDSASSPAIVLGERDATYYVRAAGYDLFGKVGLNYSDEYKVTLTNKLFDPFPTDIPDGLVLTTRAEVAADGTVTGAVFATWTAVNTDTFARYELAAAEDSGSFVIFPLAEPKWEYHGLRPGITLSVKVRTLTKNVNVPSGWSPVQTIVVALNTTPPDNPTNARVTAAFETAFVNWTAPVALDLDYVEVWASDTANREGGIAAQASKPTTTAGATSAQNGPQPAAKVGRGATFYTDPTLPTGGTRYYWLRSVNSSKIPATAFVGPLVATSASIQQLQIALGAIDSTRLAAQIIAPKIVDALPSPTNYTGPTFVVLSSDSKAYKYANGAWALAQPSDGIVATIGAGAIKADQIDAGAITADKLAVGLSSTNLLYNSDVRAAASGYSIGATSNSVAGSALAAATGDANSPAAIPSLKLTHATPASGTYTDVYSLAPQADGTFGAAATPVISGKIYQFSVYLSVLRATSAQAMILWYDSSGAVIGNPVLGTVVSTAPAAGPVGGFPRSAVFATAPAQAVRAQFAVRVVHNGAANPIVYMTNWFAGGAQPSQTTPSDYAPPSSTVISGGQITTNSILSTSIVSGTITGDKIAGGTITGAKIAANTITGDNVLAGSIQADRIKLGSSFATLASWMNGGDNTTIEGGKISANTIATNSLKIGARGVSVVGCDFSMGKTTAADGSQTANGVLSWTAGTIFYVGDSGNAASQSIAAGSIQTGGQQTFVWYTKGGTSFQAGTGSAYATAYGNADSILIATCSGFTGINVTYGGAVIDGSRIVAGSIFAQQIAANAIQADKIAAGAITADKIGAGKISAIVLNVGNTIYIEGATNNDPNFGRLYVRHANDSNRLRLAIGYIGDLQGRGPWGLAMWDTSGTLMFAPDGVNGQGIWANTITTNQLTTGRLIVNGQIFDGAVTNTSDAGSAGGSQAAVNVTARTAAARFQILAFRRGAGGQNFANTANTGNLEIYVNGGQLDAVVNCYFIYNQGLKCMMTTTMVRSYIPGTTGNFNFQVNDSSGQPGVYIAVTELSK